MDINDEWKLFLTSDNNTNDDIHMNEKEVNLTKDCVPTPSPIYISTKTNIAFLKKHKNNEICNTNATNNATININENDVNTIKDNKKEIDILSVFWSVPIISYIKPMNGIIKKQILIKSDNEEQLNNVKERLLNVTEHYEELIITSINNPEGRVKFKDTRKISIGMSKKDIVSFRCKKKSAFDNCVVFIMRLNIHGTFKEFHIKLFNTGKVEIPGVKDQYVFTMILDNLIKMLNPYVNLYLLPLLDNNMEVLINSNFNCGFYIKRDVLYKILKYEYNIPTIYDPCMYPGIQCKYNYEIKQDDGSITIKKVSFMIFRTGSVLIMGKCKEYILHEMYEFVSKLLVDKYELISQGNNSPKEEENEFDTFEYIQNLEDGKKEEPVKQRSKVRKNKKKIIIMNNQPSQEVV